MHKWDKKWNNDRSDGEREDIIERTCVNCGAQQRVIYHKGNKWAKVINFDRTGREIEFLQKCNKSEDDEPAEPYEPKNPRGPNIRTLRKQGNPTIILKKVPNAKIVAPPEDSITAELPADEAKEILHNVENLLESVGEKLQNSHPADKQNIDVSVKVTMLLINPEQLQQLITTAVREQFERIFKTV